MTEICALGSVISHFPFMMGINLATYWSERKTKSKNCSIFFQFDDGVLGKNVQEENR